VLVIEMTASFTMFLPMIAACFAAMLVPNLVGSAPIYDSLRRRVATTVTRTADEPEENTR
jgi:CIC family chloride channel protein